MLPPPINTMFMAILILLARAKNRGADAHHRRSLGDRRLHVGRHAHRERVDRKPLAAARRPARAAAQRRRAAAPGRLPSGIAISPRSFRFGSAATWRASSGSSAGVTPLLVASPLMFTCRQTFSGPISGGRCSTGAGRFSGAPRYAPRRSWWRSGASCCSGSGR